MASFFVKLKIFLAYFALAVIGGLAVWVVLVQVDELSDSGDTYSRITERGRLVNATMYYMYKSENDGMQMLLGRKSSAAYSRDMNLLYETLDSLQNFASDSMQVTRIDSIMALFAMKENSFRKVSGISNLRFYNEKINERISWFKPDSSLLNNKLLAGKKVQVRKDTIVTKRKSGNFFKRFKGVFKKESADSTVVTTTNVKVDSSYIALADSVNRVIADLQSNVGEMQSDAVEKQKSALAKLTVDNDGINDMIYRLIDDFEADETSALLKEMSLRESERDATIKVLIAAAIAAIVIILFFLWVIWRDIDKNARQKKELEQLNSDNLSLIDAREKLMLAITHDIKAPLSSIIGYADLLDRLSVDKRQKLYVSSIKKASDMLQSLVVDLLEFYRLDCNKEDLKIVAFNAAELLHSVYSLFLPVAGEKGLDLNLNVDFPKSLMLESDPLKIKQIVNNLVSNAIKFTDEGHVDILASYNDNILKIIVSDSGRGISEEDKCKLFDMFVRTGSSVGTSGFGLGLSIVDRTVKLLGGVISVESEVGKGSSFEVQLLIDRVDSPNEPDAEIIEDSAGIDDFNGRKILLVDDDELQMNLVCEICKSHGIIAYKCQYPLYAQRMVADSNPDLVITDIQMPEMNGFEVLGAIRESNSQVPVVAVTARDVDREEYLKAGFFDVLTKPFKEKDLLEIIGKVMQCDLGTVIEKESCSTGLSALCQFADGDDDATRSILESFVSQTESNLKEMEVAVDSNNIVAVNSLCHKMIPIFSMIGETDVVDILREYEHSDSIMPKSDFNRLSDLVNIVVEAAKKKCHE